MNEAYELFGCNTSNLFVISVDYNDFDWEVIDFHNTYNLGFPAISGIEGGGNAIRSNYGVGSFPSYVLIAPNHDIVEQGMWPISSTQNFIDYFENNGLSQAPCGPPTCIAAISPPDLADDTQVDITFEWEANAGATGYLIYFGTDNPPTSIENGTDLGNVTTYTPPATLDYETDYYWQIVPYNFGGEAGACAVFQFTTTLHTKSLILNAFLEGPYSGGQMTSSLNSLGFVPLNQPYNVPPWDYAGTESVASIPGNAVDWVLIDILKPYNSGNGLKFELIDRKPAFIAEDGAILDLNGVNNVLFQFSDQEFYVRIQHRNHLPIVSAGSLSGFNDIFIYDFTTGSNKVLGGETSSKELAPGTWSMIAADGNGNLQVDNSDKNEIWFPQQSMKGYYSGDYNMDSDVDEDDKLFPWELNVGRGAYPIQDTTPAK